jgi:hypothetical protein
MSRLIVDTGGRPLARERSLAAANLEWSVPLAIDWWRDDPGRREQAAAGFLLDAGSWVRLRVWKDDEGLTVLARGLAAMAYRPGGVAYLGMRWTAEDSPAGRAAA